MHKVQPARSNAARDARHAPGIAGRSATIPPVYLLAILIIAIGATVLFAHWPALSAKALSFDDQEYLVDNSLVRNPSWSSAGRFLSEVRNPSTVGGYYQPLTMISLMLDCAAGGGPDNLAPFHRTSLALHVANTSLIIILLYLLLGNPWAAALAGLLFGVHPMTVEPIPWVGERKTLLATFFALGSLVSYVRYVQTKRRSWYGAALAAFVLALMSKPTPTPLPLLLLLLDFWPLRRLSRRAVTEKVPFFLIAAVSAVITYISQKTSGGVYDPGELSPLRVPLTFCHNVVFYPCKMIWPVNLTSHYAFPEPMSALHPMVLAGVVGTALAIPLLLISLRWTRALLTSVLFFLVAIFPTMGPIGFTNVIASDKFAYFPVVGLLLALAALLAALWGRPPRHADSPGRRLAIVAGVLALSGLEIAATRSYLVHWRDSNSLHEHMVRLAPSSAVLRNNLANMFVQQGKLDEAVAHYRKALQIRPGSSEVLSNLAIALADQGKLDQAVACYNESLRLDPTNAQAHNNLAIALTDQGKIDEAVKHFTEAQRLRPDYAEYHYRLANALVSQGKQDEAVTHYNEALRLKPVYPEAHDNLAVALAGQGRLDQAVAHSGEALRLNPTNPKIHNNLANILAMQGRLDEAIGHYDEALRLDPAYAEAHNNLATALARQGKLDDAVTQYVRALQLKPNYPAAHLGLANALALLGRLDEAVQHFQETLRSNPASASAHKGLGAVLERQGNVEAAMREYQEALRLDPRDKVLRDRLEAASYPHANTPPR